ncbi:MAG: hypothetical protein NC191_05645 [Muribaculaceae bacterium]|nr:hypothetical protein [Muribaculaceae bacterium]
MNIQKINTIPKFQRTNIQNNRPSNNAQTDPVQNTCATDYSRIPFGAIHNVQQPKKLINVEQEKAKLLKQLDDILQTQPDNYTKEELMIITIHRNIKFTKAQIERIKKLENRLDEIIADTKMNQQQRTNALFEAEKEFKHIKNHRSLKPETHPLKKPGNEKIDYKLINRFKTAILSDNFRLDKVYKNYYQDLENINTIKELNKKYPKIKVPPRPEDIIAQKIVSTLTRDFYEDFSHKCKIGAEEGFDFSDKKIKKIFHDISQKYGFDEDYLYVKAAKATHMAIVDVYKNAKLNGFSTLHGHRKNTTPQITELDLKLLALNFDDVVLSTVRQQYLEGKKPNEIVYKFQNTEIPIKSLSNTEYKFEKVPEKPRSLIKIAEKIHQGQRSYNLFNHDMLLSRLDYFSNTELVNSDELFEQIIQFSECKPQDRQNIIRFLQELDKINDGEKSIKSGLKTIAQEKIKPLETERINNEQYQAELQRKKLEQEKKAKLNDFKSEFDNVLDVLYLNDMTDIATICSKYRPKNLEPKTLEDTKFLIKTINDNTNEFSEINKLKVETYITNWDTYKYYEANDPKNPIFIKATQFATDSEGNLDMIKAGQFITNSEIIQTYPQSLEFAPNPELLKRIMEKKSDNIDAALTLCKLNDYTILEDNEKASVIKLLEMFDLKNTLDKVALKNIIENNYAQTDTKSTIELNENDSIETTMSAKAKQEIIEKYKFPNCLEYLEAFENALSKMATARGSAGVKLLSKNNEAIEYKMELKINGHDDRLFSSENNYYFDIFSARGLH